MSFGKLKPWGQTDEGHPVFRIKGKEYVFMNRSLYLNGNKVKDPSILNLFSGIIATHTINNVPSVLNKDNNKETESIVRGVLEQVFNIKIATTKLLASVRIKIFAMRWRAFAGSRKLMKLNKRRKIVSVNTDANTTFEFAINNENSKLMHGKETMNFRKVN